MKRLTALILAFVTVFTVFTANANAIDIHDAVTSGISERKNGIPVENDFVLYFRKAFRTLLNDLFTRANADFLIMATDIKLDMENIAVEVGKKAYLKAKVDPKGAKNKNINWYSDNTAVAGVTDGMVSGRTVGTATIYAITDDGSFYDKCTVTVKPATNSAKFTVSYIDCKGGLISKQSFSTATATLININKAPTLTPEEGEFLGWMCENNGVLYQNGTAINVKDFIVYDDEGKAKSFEIVLRESVKYGISGNDPDVILFGGTGDDIYRDIEPSGDGGYFACGTTTSINGVFKGKFESDWISPYAFISKIGADGKTEWIKTLGTDYAGVYISDIAVLSDGNIVAVGYHSIDSVELMESKGAAEAVIYKLSGDNGSVISQKVMDGKKSDVFNCVAKTTKGFAVGGKTASTEGDFEGYSGNCALLLHFDNELNVLWSKTMSGAKGGSIDGISADNSGNIFISCTTSSTDGDFASFKGLMGGYIDTVIIKYNHSGTRQWYYVIATSGREEFRAIQADGSGGCIVGGQYELFTAVSPDGTLSGVHNCGGIDALLMSINSYGILNWTKVLSGLGNDYITDIAKGSKGYAVTGYTNSANREFTSIGNLGEFDAYVCYVNNSGTTLKMIAQAGTAEDTASCVACTGANFIVAGRTKSKDGSFAYYSGSNYMGYTAKYTVS